MFFLACTLPNTKRQVAFLITQSTLLHVSEVRQQRPICKCLGFHVNSGSFRGNLLTLFPFWRELSFYSGKSGTLTLTPPEILFDYGNSAETKSLKQNVVKDFNTALFCFHISARNQPTQMSWDPYFKAWIPCTVLACNSHVMVK